MPGPLPVRGNLPITPGTLRLDPATHASHIALSIDTTTVLSNLLRARVKARDVDFFNVKK